MHYDEQRENDRAHNSVSKTQTTLSYALSENQHLTISWQLDELVLDKIAKAACANLFKKQEGMN